MICLEDFCGQWGHFPATWWADYDLQRQTVFFGGEWADVPNWHIATQPTLAELYIYVGSHLPEFANITG